MMIIKSIFYSVMLLQMYIVCTFAIPAINPNLQVGKIQSAKTGMRSCAMKAAACTIGSETAAMFGANKKSDKLAAKAEGHLKDYKGHAEKLRAAVEQKVPEHKFGGASTAKQQNKIVSNGKKKVAQYDNRVARANKAGARQNSGSLGRMNSFDEMH